MSNIRVAKTIEAKKIGAFFDDVVLYMDNRGENYPKWTYKVYPSTSFAVSMAEKGQLYLAIEDGELLGEFVLNEDPQGDYEKGKWSKDLKRGEFLVCHSLAVAPSSFGKGIGEAMGALVIRKAKEEGYKAVRLDVAPGNFPAIRLYEKCGFSYIGDEDLDRGYDFIPKFSLMEYNF